MGRIYTKIPGDKVTHKKVLKAGLICNEKEASDAAQDVLDVMNKEFIENYNTSFESTLVKMKKLENTKTRKQQSRSVKKQTESTWKKTAVLRSFSKFIVEKVLITVKSS